MKSEDWISMALETDDDQNGEAIARETRESLLSELWYVHENVPYGEYVWIAFGATAEEAVANVKQQMATTEDGTKFSATKLEKALNELSKDKPAVWIGGYQE